MLPSFIQDIPLSVVPFLVLLGLIATGPLYYAKWWHRYHPHSAILLASTTMAYYVVYDRKGFQLIPHALQEYMQFMALIASLYLLTSNVLITFNAQPTPGVNVLILYIGAVLANVIGTTGASMLLIKPYMRLNKKYLKPYHIIFFIFIVSNVGGAITPMADAPLLFGYLKGVPFTWTLKHNVLAWLVMLATLGSLFYIRDRIAQKPTMRNKYAGKKPFVTIKGGRYLIGLIPIISALLLANPHNTYHVMASTATMFGVACWAYFYADKYVHHTNSFSIAPLREIAFLFLGIFVTMIPALTYIQTLAKNHPEWITPSKLYWATGSLSSILDNAPTYMSFLNASLTKFGDIATLVDMSQGGRYLQAIAQAAVFFGAATYIGNGPNFMVKAIAEKEGVKMPSFFIYTLCYATTYLLPGLVLVWGIFFRS